MEINSNESDPLGNSERVDGWAVGLEPVTRSKRKRRRRLKYGAAAVLAAGAVSAGSVAWSGAATSTKKGHDTTAAAANGRPVGGPHGPGLAGAVTAVGADSITLTTHDGTSVTVTTNASTTYELGNKAGTSSDVAVGDNVSIMPTSTSTQAAPVAAEVDVLVPALSGAVTSDNGSTIVVTDNQGFSRVIDVTGSTTYTEGTDTSVTASAVTVGSQIMATGSVDSDKTDLDATNVEVILPQHMGKVTAVSGTTITISEMDGTSLAIETTASTVFRSGTSSSSLSAVTVGSAIAAVGTVSGETFSAVEVDLLPARPAGSSGASGRPASPGGLGGPGGPGGLFGGPPA